jgi:predicted nuclease with RNAse H fold
MNIPLTAPTSFYIGWDVGGWNCGKNQKSRDAIVIIDSNLSIVGRPWRGNLRGLINESTSTGEFIRKLFCLAIANLKTDNARIILAIDTPLGFSNDFVGLVAGYSYVEPVESSGTNPYLFRKTERYLFQHGLRPLSAIKDMLGSQATKGIHVLAKFAPNVLRCGVWSNGESLTAIEVYPSACKSSTSINALRQQVRYKSIDNQDEQDALSCALVAYLFENRSNDLIAPPDSVPESEGWIWIPKDIIEGMQP